VSDVTIRCVLCSAEFNDEVIAGVNACPECGTASLPMSVASDVQVTVNWHELRILGMWAENWAVHIDKADCVQVVRAIAGRLQAQHPERSAITMSGELSELRQAVKEQGGTVQHDPRYYVPEEGREG